MADNMTLFHAYSEEEMISLSVTISVNMALSLFGNLLIIIVLVKRKRLRSNFANQLVLSLAVTDVAAALVPMNYQLATFIDISLIMQGGFLCSMGALFSYFVFLVSILTMVRLTIDRFIALGYPLKYNLHLTAKVKLLMIAYPWAHGLVFGTFCGVFITIQFDPVSMDCGLNWKERELWFIITVFTINFIIPSTMLAVMNLMTLRLVRCQNKILVRQTSEEFGARTAAESVYMTRRGKKCEKLIDKIYDISLSFLFSCFYGVALEEMM